jgi:hypothetical protein
VGSGLRSRYMVAVGRSLHPRTQLLCSEGADKQRRYLRGCPGGIPAGVARVESRQGLPRCNPGKRRRLTWHADGQLDSRARGRRWTNLDDGGPGASNVPAAHGAVFARPRDSRRLVLHERGALTVSATRSAVSGWMFRSASHDAVPGRASRGSDADEPSPSRAAVTLGLLVRPAPRLWPRAFGHGFYP